LPPLLDTGIRILFREGDWINYNLGPRHPDQRLGFSCIAGYGPEYHFGLIKSVSQEPGVTQFLCAGDDALKVILHETALTYDALKMTDTGLKEHIVAAYDYCDGLKQIEKETRKNL